MCLIRHALRDGDEMESAAFLVFCFGGIMAVPQIPLSLRIAADDDTISNLQLLIPMKNPDDSKNITGNVVMVLEASPPVQQTAPRSRSQVPPITPLLIDRAPSIYLSDDDDDERNDAPTSKELLSQIGGSSRSEEIENGMILLSTDDQNLELPPSTYVAERNLKSSLQYLCAGVLAREQIVLSQPNESLRRSEEAHLPPQLIRNLCRSYLRSLMEIRAQEKPQAPSAPFRNLKNLQHLKKFKPSMLSNLGSSKFNKNQKLTQTSFKDMLHRHVLGHMKEDRKNRGYVLGNTSSEENFRVQGKECSVCALIRQIAEKFSRSQLLNRRRRFTTVAEEYPGMFKRAARTAFHYKLKKRGDLRMSVSPELLNGY